MSHKSRRHRHSDESGRPPAQRADRNFLGPAELNGDVLALHEAESAKAQPKCLDPARPIGGQGRAQESNGRRLRRLLRPRDYRPSRRRAAEQRDELARLTRSPPQCGPTLLCSSHFVAT